MGLFDVFKRKKNKQEQFFYTESEMEQYETYIAEQFGEFDGVFHEIISPDIHLDVIIVPPTPENNYYKLITMGMGAYKMDIPDELNQYELKRAELILYLPPTWNVGSDKEEDYWPIRQLKGTARIPVQCDTWLGYGHTVSSDEENTPYADNTGFCSMMLLNGVNLKGEELDLRMETIGKINFYQLFPLYKEELEYKQGTDADTLLNLFDEADRTPIINISRKNYGIR